MSQDPSASELALSGDTTIRATPEQVSSGLGEETVILALERGEYYGLDSVATRIWRLIQEPTTVDTVRDILLEEFEVEPERCERDLHALLAVLLREGLAERVEAEDGADS